MKGQEQVCLKSDDGANFCSKSYPFKCHSDSVCLGNLHNLVAYRSKKDPRVLETSNTELCHLPLLASWVWKVLHRLLTSGWSHHPNN